MTRQRCALVCISVYIWIYSRICETAFSVYLNIYSRICETSYTHMLTEHTRSFTHNIRLHYIYYVYIHGYAIMRIRSLKRTLFYLYFLFTYTSFIFHTETHIVIHVCTFMDVRNMRIRMCISVYIWIYSRICETAYSVYLNIYSTCVFACSRKRTLIYIYTSLIHIHIFFFTLKHISLYTHMLYRCRDREIEGKI